MNRQLNGCFGIACAAISLFAGACGTAGGDAVAATRDAGIVDSSSDRPNPPSPIPPEGLGCTGTKAAFCADFDQGPLEKGWDGPAPALRRDVVRSTSSPASLLLAAPPAGVDVIDGWKLTRGLQGSTGLAQLAFDIERNQFPETAGITCARVRLFLPTNAEVLKVDLKFHRDKVSVQVSPRLAGVLQAPLTGAFDALDANRFQRVALSVDSRAAAPTVRVSFDGIPSLEVPLGGASLGEVTQAGLELGFLDEDTPFEWRVRLDDVTFDFR